MRHRTRELLSGQTAALINAFHGHDFGVTTGSGE